MSKGNEILKNEIYPALYRVLPEALPEFEFTRRADRYKSTNTLKVTGETDGDGKGKVEVKEAAPYWINDYRGGSCTIWKYIKDKEDLTPGETFKRLAQLAQIILPEQELTPEEIARIQQSQFEANLWETVNGFFIDCLSNENNKHALTPRAQKVREYLVKPISEGGRGYTGNVIALPQQSGQPTPIDRDAPRMELGYIPSTVDLRDYLLSVGFTDTDISPVLSALNTHHHIGTENVLTFPYRDHTGKIRGMVFRTLQGGDTKYLYSKGLKRSQILFNLRAVARDTDLTIVESPLDALHAAALGIKSITALGGSGDTLNKTQIDLALKFGAKRITLLLDNDRAGSVGTDKAVAFMQTNYPALRVFVGEFPEGAKDLDELLTTEGVEGYQRVKDSAIESWRYQLDRTLTRYSNLAVDGEYLTPKQVASLLEEVVSHSAALPVIDRDQYLKCFTDSPGIDELGISTKSVEDTAKAIRGLKAKEERAKATQQLLVDSKAKLEKGDESGALDLLTERARKIKQTDKAETFAKLSTVTSEQQIKDRIRNRPEPLNSGYTIDGEPLKIPAAAISIVAGSTSHGKSILLANLALNLAREYRDKTFHIFSYEVDEERYLMNLLNPYIGDEKLAHNNRESIEAYFRGKSVIQGKFKAFPLFSPGKADVFTERAGYFFKELIDSGRIKVHYVTYDSDELIEAVRHLNTAEPLGAVLVDYVQLIYTPTGKLRNPSRQEEIKQMCLDFKDLSIETGLPLIFGAQFNREVQNLTQMHGTKLGEAGDLERIADLILGIWNNSRKWVGTPSKSEMNIIEERVGLDPDPATWYVEILKRRGGKVEVWDIWDYLANAAKVVSK